jgi:flagellar assembly protein FliH
MRLGTRLDTSDERAAARAAGYAEGWSAGCRQAQAEASAEQARQAELAQRAEQIRQDQVERSVAALAQAASDLRSRSVSALTEITDLVLESAIGLAEALLAAELTIVHERGLPALRRALAPLPVEGRVVVRLHPDDLAGVRSHLIGDTARSVDGHEVELVADASLRPGDAVADQGATRVDARLDAALARVRAALNTEGASE